MNDSRTAFLPPPRPTSPRSPGSRRTASRGQGSATGTCAPWSATPPVHWSRWRPTSAARRRSSVPVAADYYLAIARRRRGGRRRARREAGVALGEDPAAYVAELAARVVGMPASCGVPAHHDRRRDAARRVPADPHLRAGRARARHRRRLGRRAHLRRGTVGRRRDAGGRGRRPEWRRARSTPRRDRTASAPEGFTVV